MKQHFDEVLSTDVQKNSSWMLNLFEQSSLELSIMQKHHHM